MDAARSAKREAIARKELARIDINLRLNWCLVSDGPHPAVDYREVWRAIDDLLEYRFALTGRR